MQLSDTKLISDPESDPFFQEKSHTSVPGMAASGGLPVQMS